MGTIPWGRTPNLGPDAYVRQVRRSSPSPQGRGEGPWRCPARPPCGAPSPPLWGLLAPPLWSAVAPCGGASRPLCGAPRPLCGGASPPLWSSLAPPVVELRPLCGGASPPLWSEAPGGADFGHFGLFSVLVGASPSPPLRFWGLVALIRLIWGSVPAFGGPFGADFFPESATVSVILGPFF